MHLCRHLCLGGSDGIALFIAGIIVGVGVLLGGRLVLFKQSGLFGRSLPGSWPRRKQGFHRLRCGEE